jgi:hypothetical protein
VDLNQILEHLEARRTGVQEELRGLDAAVNALKGLGGRRGRRSLSPAARKRISLAQKARWAKFKKQKRGA